MTLALSLAAAALVQFHDLARSENANSTSTAAIHLTFRHPPAEYRPMVRWWWPGGDVRDAELRREVDELDLAGFGGAEIQPLSMNFPAKLPADVRARVFSAGTPRYFQHVRTAVEEARHHGMWIDVTLGSGWPAGGGEAVTPERCVTDLRYSETAAKGGERFRRALDLPSISGSGVGQFVHGTMGDPIQANPPGWDDRLKARARTVAVLAYRVVPPVTTAPAIPMPGAAATILTSGSIDLDSRIDLTGQVAGDGTLDWQVPPGEWHIFAFRQVAMNDQVMGGAMPGPRLIVDHFSQAAFDAYMQQFGKPMVDALADRFGHGLRALFYDSLEIPADLYWSDDFLQQFESRRGYSLVPYLPLIIQFGYNNGYSSAVSKPLYDRPGIGAAVRRDYWKTVGELILEDFYEPFNAWASGHGLLTRTQAHGAPADLLKVYGRSNIPETEQMAVADHAPELTSHFTKMASSAADLYGRHIVSSESFASSGEPYWTTPGAIREKADRLFVAGINQIVYHGFPYTYDDRPYPGWGAFNNGSTTASFGMFMSERNTFWRYLPRINAYISRLQYISQTGTSVTPVAVLATRVGYPLSGFPEPQTTQALAQGGYAYSHINADALLSARIENGTLVTVGGARFAAIVIDDSTWLEPSVAAMLEKSAQQGVAVVIVGRLPSESATLKDFDTNSRIVRDAVAALLALPRAKHVETIDAFIRALSALTAPNVSFHEGPALPFIEKRLGMLETFFFSNPSNRSVTVELAVAAAGSPQLWDPWTGAIRPYGGFRSTDQAKELTLNLDPHGSVLLVFDPTDRHAPQGIPEAAMEPATTIAITGPWNFSGIGHVIDGSEARIRRSLPQLIDWAQDRQLKGFSGRASYATHFSIPGRSLAGVKKVTLDLGDVEDVAEVTLNGKGTPALLMAPYTIDVTKLVRPGNNLLEITAVNSLSNSASPRPPFYALPVAGMESARSFVPRRSGLLGPVNLGIAY